MMLIGTFETSTLVESGEAELRELLKHVNELKSPDYVIWESPYTNMVFPDYVNVSSISSYQFDYELKMSARAEATTDWKKKHLEIMTGENE